MFTLEVFTAVKTDVEGIKVLRIPGSRFVAEPHNGRYSCSRYAIIDLNNREEAYHPCIQRKEVADFLSCMMRMEKEEASAAEHIHVDETEKETVNQLSLF